MQIWLQNKSRKSLVDYLLSASNFASALHIVEHGGEISRFVVKVPSWRLLSPVHCVLWSCAKL